MILYTSVRMILYTFKYTTYPTCRKWKLYVNGATILNCCHSQPWHCLYKGETDFQTGNNYTMFSSLLICLEPGSLILNGKKIISYMNNWRLIWKTLYLDFNFAFQKFKLYRCEKTKGITTIELCQYGVKVTTQQWTQDQNWTRNFCQVSVLHTKQETQHQSKYSSVNFKLISHRHKSKN